MFLPFLADTRRTRRTQMLPHDLCVSASFGEGREGGLRKHTRRFNYATAAKTVGHRTVHVLLLVLEGSTGATEAAGDVAFKI